MGAIEDVPKLLQDFIAPELREIKARLDGVDRRLDGLSKDQSQRAVSAS